MINKHKKKSFVSFSIKQFIYFFILMAFIVTCNMILFLHNMDLTEEKIREAAPITLFNIVILTLIFCMIDQIRRRQMITKPVRKIQEAINSVVAGDFSTRVEKVTGGSTYEYDSIIDGLNKMIAELGSVETLRTDFIANVSHELKTPLAVVQNYGTLLQAADISKEQRLEYAAKIIERTRRLSSLITNILKLNKLENQQIFPQIKIYNVSEQICEDMLAFENVWEEKSIDIETDIDEVVNVTADKEMMSLVWNNLISNAIKFTESGGRISLSVKNECDKAVICVKDTGCGMNEKTGKNIFKKFYQGDTSHAMQGNGLGLALVKRIIDIHKGEIFVSSQVGVGTTFTVKLKK